MNKIKIYIDFEAISSPFNWSFNAKEDWPFAYSIGTFEKTKFITKSFVMDFGHLKSKIKGSQIDGLNIFDELKLNLKKDIEALLKNPNVNFEQITFVAWSGDLERRILWKLFGKKIEVIDQNSDMHASLKIITSKEIPVDKYFTSFRQDVIKNLDKNFYEKRGLKYDGALAALGGYILLLTQTKRNGKWLFETDQKTLLKEMIEYSLDDVLRMGIIEKNGKEWFDTQLKLNQDRNEQISSLSKAKSKNERLLRELKNFDENLTIKDVIKSIEKENVKNIKLLENIKK